MSMAADHPKFPAKIARLITDWPLLPLGVLLIGLIGILQIMQPGVVTEPWLGNTVKFAIPLAMLAACQTLTMLTGGIDLSAGTVATITAFVTAFVTATLTPLIGAPEAVMIALSCALLTGLLNGFGVAICRVHPLIMTLGTGLIVTGCRLVCQRFVISTGTKIPDVLVWSGLAWHGTDLWGAEWPCAVRAFRGAADLGPKAHRFWPVAVCCRFQ